MTVNDCLQLFAQLIRATSGCSMGDISYRAVIKSISDGTGQHGVTVVKPVKYICPSMKLAPPQKHQSYFIAHPPPARC